MEKSRIFGKYRKPKAGEIVRTKFGPARISRLFQYDDVTEEMRKSGATRKEIAQFRSRVRFFLGKTSRYYECELTYANGEIEYIDWSDYLTLRRQNYRS